MTKLFLSTHGRMASGMKSSIDILMGSSDNLTVCDAYIPGENISIKDEVDKFLASCDADETKILLSDIKGGSVNQVLAQYSNYENVYVITGVSLALLLDLMARSFNNITKEELEELVLMAREMTELVTLEFDVPDDSFF